MQARVSAAVWRSPPAIGELLTSENSGENFTPQTPAAALLFQAPAFVEPVSKPATREPRPKDEEPSAKSSSDSQASDGQGRGNRGGRSRGGQQPGSGRQQKQGSGTGPASGSASSGSGSSGKSKQGQKKQSQNASNATDEQKSPTRANAKQTSQKASGEKGDESEKELPEHAKSDAEDQQQGTARRRRRRTRPSAQDRAREENNDPADQVQGLKGSTRLEAKRMRRREGRRDSRRRQSITESEFLARRESVDREMVVRHQDGSDQIAILEDGILVEHFVARRTTQSVVGNIYLGRVQNVLPSMEAAFVDIGRGRNAVLYAGEVNWDVLGAEGKPRRIETALKSGETVMVQVTKDPIGHKGARLTSQITLAGRYLVYVPGSSMLGISRKLPDSERARLKKILRQILPENAGVIVRTAAEGATEEQLRDDVTRLTNQWESIEKKSETTRKAPVLLRGEPELVVRVVRDLFNEDFSKLVVQGDETWTKVYDYVDELSPELTDRLEHWTSGEDVFHAKKVQQQLAKAMDRKVWLPSGGTLVIERTEALTVVDVNTGKFVGSGGTLEETVTRNNLEAAEEIVRQLRLRDIGGIIIIDFVDMVLESNRELVMRRLIESLGRDRTRHQVTEITSLGLVQMTRKRVGEGLVEAFSTNCEVCEGRGFIVHDHPVEPGQKYSHPAPNHRSRGEQSNRGYRGGSGTRSTFDIESDRDSGRGRGRGTEKEVTPETHVGDEKVRTALHSIAAASALGGATSGEDSPETDEKAQHEPVKSAPAAKDVSEQGKQKSGQKAAKSGSKKHKSKKEPKAKQSKPDKAKSGQSKSGKQEKAAPVEPARVARRAAGSPPPADKVETQQALPASGPATLSVDDITLPVKKQDEVSGGRSRKRSSTSGAKVAPRRAAKRAAGSPPSSTQRTEEEANGAKEAVRELLEGQ